MTVVVAQLGARMHYAVPRIFHKACLLEHLFTDICAVKGWPRLLKTLPSFLCNSGLQRLLGRVPQGVPRELITAFTQFGYEYAQRRQKAQTSSEATAVHLWASDRFNNLIIMNDFCSTSVVYGFNSACERVFSFAKKRGQLTIMEQTIAPRLIELHLLEEEALENKAWGAEVRDDYAAEFAEKEHREWELADRIICASDFVRKQIAAVGGPAEKCLVIPYGVELEDFICSGNQFSRQRTGPLQVLFVGGVGLRKGVYYLLEAMRLLQNSPVHCRIVGSLGGAGDILLRSIPRNVEFIGSVPRSMIVSEYARADVFCLPSLCEGSATVVYEALASGLPVVTTPNAGSIVRDNVEGFIVPIRDAEALADRLGQLSSDEQLLHQMSIAARKRSAYGSLDAYSDRLIGTLTNESLLKVKEGSRI